MSIPTRRSPAAGRPARARTSTGGGGTGARFESTSAVVEQRWGGRTAMSKRRPDPVDERILSLLVRNARLSWRDVGEVVGLSANAVAQRVKRLEADGWIL